MKKSKKLKKIKKLTLENITILNDYHQSKVSYIFLQQILKMNNQRIYFFSTSKNKK